jgi:hypothetical protein
MPNRGTGRTTKRSAEKMEPGEIVEQRWKREGQEIMSKRAEKMEPGEIVKQRWKREGQEIMSKRNVVEQRWKGQETRNKRKTPEAET